MSDTTIIDAKAVEEASKQISEKKQDVKYDTRDYVIRYLVDQFSDGEFYIPLDYQRKFIWSDKDKCNFIESVLMGLPIPLMFFADTTDGRIEIVDGAQRIQTLVQFSQNDLTLQNLKVLTKANNFKFTNFDISIQRRFLNTSIRVVFLEEGTTDKTRQEIFKRINTGGERVNPTEARRGSIEGKFKDFIEECTKNELFNKLAPRTKLTEDRYEGFELVSRFLHILTTLQQIIKVMMEMLQNILIIILKKKTIFGLICRTSRSILNIEIDLQVCLNLLQSFWENRALGNH